LKNYPSRPGYIALLSVLIVSTVAAMTVIILFVTSLSTVFNSGDVGDGKKARAFADACVEVALQEITNQTPTDEDCDQVVPNATCNFSGSPWTSLQPWPAAPSQGDGYCYLIATSNIGTVVDGDGEDDTRWRIRAAGAIQRGSSMSYTDDAVKFVEADAYRAEHPDVLSQWSSATVERWVECVGFPGDINTACTVE